MNQRIETAFSLIASSYEGFLATLEGDKPFVSAVSYLYEANTAGQKQPGKLCLLLSELARHTRNFQRNPNVSLLVLENSSVPVYERKRVTVQGTIQYVKDEERFKSFKSKYIQIFPSSEPLFTFQDFRFFEMNIADVHLISGFGKVDTFR